MITKRSHRRAALIAGHVLLSGLSTHVAAGEGPAAHFPLDNAPIEGVQPAVGGNPPVQVVPKDGGLPALAPGAAAHTGKAWDFSRNGGFLVAPYGPPVHSLGDIENTDGITLAFWIKHTFEARDQNHRVMTGHGIDVVLSKGRHHLGIILDSVVNMQIKPAGGDLPTPPVCDGTWHHVAVTADFAQQTGNARVYIDGRCVNTIDGRFLKPFNRADAAAKFVIGARNHGSAYPFRGSLDEVMFHDRPLSEDEVLALYEGPVSAGAARQVVMPDACSLAASAPDDVPLRWTKHSGPGEVTFSNPQSRSGTARFAEPGEYVLSFSAGKTKRMMAVLVRAAEPPQLRADGVLLEVGQTVAPLKVETVIPGRPGVASHLRHRV